MKRKKAIPVIFILIIQLINGIVLAQSNNHMMNEQYRPQVHFSPEANWINDPNGMVYSKGIYHLFFQYHPYSTVWGPMHWGHATSTDMIHWKQQPVAIYPDTIGTIFSGSAVVDKNNTSGFGKKGQAPLVAIFTQHDANGEKAGRNDFQNQSIAYSNDEGKTWIKYAGNPVIKNPGIRDFRDPKVMWYEAGKKWVMTLATSDRVTFYSSADLKQWKKESEFGQNAGAHGGGWECPDLFTMDDNGKIVWVLVVNLNPGGPNKGSGTQYFLGNFDGNTFTPNSTETKWIDYGPDNYAGITWSNTGERKIFLGWMSNWMYANLVPSVKWKNAMTIPRDLRIVHAGKNMYISSLPVRELNTIHSKSIISGNITVSNDLDLAEKTGKIKVPCTLNLTMEESKDFSLVLLNEKNEKLIIGFDKKNNQYFIDRSASGKTAFHNEFAAKHIAPRLTNKKEMNLSIVLDESSAELFADDGLTVMTAICFPATPYNQVHIQTNEAVVFKKIEYIALKSIWP